MLCRTFSPWELSPVTVLLTHNFRNCARRPGWWAGPEAGLLLGVGSSTEGCRLGVWQDFSSFYSSGYPVLDTGRG